MWELRRALLKAQKEKPPKKGQSTVKKAHQPPLKRNVTTYQNPPQSGWAPEPDENPPLSGRVAEPGKIHPRVVESLSLKNPPLNGPSLNGQVSEPD